MNGISYFEIFGEDRLELPKKSKWYSKRKTFIFFQKDDIEKCRVAFFRWKTVRMIRRYENDLNRCECAASRQFFEGHFIE